MRQGVSIPKSTNLGSALLTAFNKDSLTWECIQQPIVNMFQCAERLAQSYTLT